MPPRTPQKGPTRARRGSSDMRQWIGGAGYSMVSWGQDEKFWSYKMLNVFLGPTRVNPYILGEFESQDARITAYFKRDVA